MLRDTIAGDSRELDIQFHFAPVTQRMRLGRDLLKSGEGAHRREIDLRGSSRAAPRAAEPASRPGKTTRPAGREWPGPQSWLNPLRSARVASSASFRIGFARLRFPLSHPLDGRIAGLSRTKNAAASEALLGREPASVLGDAVYRKCSGGASPIDSRFSLVFVRPPRPSAAPC
jgi:hypothetical protein